MQKTKKFKEKPWYFATTMLPWIGELLFGKVMSAYITDDVIRGVLNKSISFRILVPIAGSIVILLVCMGIYTHQLKCKAVKRSTFDKRTEVEKLMLACVNDFEYIECMQAYDFRITGDNEYRYIKLNYLTGVADERIDINAIMQSYFYFRHPIYKKIIRAANWYNKAHSATKADDKIECNNQFMEEGQRVCDEILGILNNITDIDQIGQIHCELYRTLVRFLSALCGKAINSALNDKDVEKALICKKRTGILGSIILDGVYVFKNENSMNKNNRVYFSFPYEYSRKNKIIILASMNLSCLAVRDEENIGLYCENIVAKIYEMSKL